MKSLRGTSTIEVMIIAIAFSMVLSVAYGAKAAGFGAYRDMIHRDRAQLYAMETFEELEALRRTRIQQNFPKSWELFLGSLNDGVYQFVRGRQINELQLGPLFVSAQESLSDPLLVREYDGTDETNNVDGFYSRLERRIFVETVPADGDAQRKKVTVSVFWGIPGTYSDQHSQQLRMQAVFREDTASALVY